MRDATIKLFQTQDHACGYWPERVARDVILDPNDAALPMAYPHMLGLGFRRSGGHVYRPRCAACQACVPLRIPVASFVPNRSQKRCLARNARVGLFDQPAHRSGEVFSLYRRYLHGRHPGGGMEASGADEFDSFLTSAWSPTRFFEFREAGRLLAVAATDVLPNALSAVYTFYDPELVTRGLGTLAVLRQIEWAKLTGRAHVYLGFWIEGHPKMAYKSSFQPAEILTASGWCKQVLTARA
ncbi:MAG: arginyltransferase [Pseudomarimonas sp.]